MVVVDLNSFFPVTISIKEEEIEASVGGVGADLCELSKKISNPNSLD